jgi:excinuclease ABC subunit C
MMNKEELKYSSSLIPDLPGVYLFYNEAGKILYIGKAKNLRKRVASYFQGNKNHSNKIKILVRKTTRIEHFIVENESDALLLENNLIKKHQPKYNILLKDDKTYPWICIKNENFPRIFSTRNISKDGSEYFGPYTSAYMVKTLLELIRHSYQLRTCKYNLTSKNINGGKFKICLEYHMGNCKGPCEAFQSEAEYNESILQIKEILKGNIKQVIDNLKKRMSEFAYDLKFEEAEFIKNKIDILNKFQSKSTIVNPKINDLDVFSFMDGDNSAIVNFIKVSNGAIIQSHTIELIKGMEETKSELLLFAVINLRNRFNSNAKEIVVPFNIDLRTKNIRITVPQKGDKLKLLKLSLRNAGFHKNEIERKTNAFLAGKQKSKSLLQLKEDLRLKEIPYHIECFDNSNLQGKFPVAACVVFKDGKPKKSEYRYYNIRSVDKPDDFATMEEVVFRRYHRLLKEKQGLPQLIIIDGGKGQLNAALKSLVKLNLDNKINVIAIAKKLEKIFSKYDSIPLFINKNSQSLKLIQNLRNEAHRFGVNFHRSKREKSLLKTELESIPGIGQTTVNKLIDHFKFYENVIDASINELKKIVDKRKAAIIWKYYHEDNKT